MPGDWSVGSDQVIAVGAQKLMPQNTAFWHFKPKKLLGVSDIPASHVLFQSLYLPKIQMHQGKELFFLPLPLRPGMWPHLNRPFHRMTYRLISVPHPFSLVISTKFLFCPLSITCFAGMVVTLLSHLRGGKHCVLVYMLVKLISLFSNWSAFCELIFQRTFRWQRGRFPLASAWETGTPGCSWEYCWSWVLEVPSGWGACEARMGKMEWGKVKEPPVMRIKGRIYKNKEVEKWVNKKAVVRDLEALILQVEYFQVLITCKVWCLCVECSGGMLPRSSTFLKPPAEAGLEGTQQLWQERKSPGGQEICSKTTGEREEWGPEKWGDGQDVAWEKSLFRKVMTILSLSWESRKFGKQPPLE